MAASKAVWGVDIGQCVLKAVKLREVEQGHLVIEAFEVIEHSSVLSQPDIDLAAVVQASLNEFMCRQDMTDATAGVSVLGQSSFMRFVKLPPVEKKKIPDIVRFEAEQQIPFPIDEVIWRYQMFEIPDSPQIEAGIFAIKQIDIAQMLSYLAPVGMGVDFLQMPPLALYNFMICDNHIAPDGATMLTDVGADKTHLVIADGGRIWTRTINIGGNNFTQALMKSFKLPFSKAEKLKRTAAASKYARQIFQVMRPVFAELVQEIQRSVGHYKTIHRESEFRQLIGIGDGFRLPGMQKYLEQNLDMKVSRVTKFNLVPDASQDFQERILSFGVAYGLGLQALGYAPVNTNMLPEKIVAQRLWAKKKPWFIAAAAGLVLAASMFMFRGYADFGVLESPAQKINHDEAMKYVAQMEQWQSEDAKEGDSFDKYTKEIEKRLVLRAYTRIWPAINSAISEAILNTTVTSQRDRRDMSNFASADEATRESLAMSVQSPQAMMGMIDVLPYVVSETTDKNGEAPVISLREKLLQRLGKIPRNKRRLIILWSQEASYLSNLNPEVQEAPVADYDDNNRRNRRKSKTIRTVRSKKVPRGFVITIVGIIPLEPVEANKLVGELMGNLNRQINADPNIRVDGNILHKRLAITEIKGEVVTAKTGRTGDAGRSKRKVRTYPAGSVMGIDSAAGTGDTETEDVVIAPDKLFPAETTMDDVGFKLTIRVEVTGDGVKAEEKEENKTK